MLSFESEKELMKKAEPSVNSFFLLNVGSFFDI
jgi:hypothetical protein